MATTQTTTTFPIVILFNYSFEDEDDADDDGQYEEREIFYQLWNDAKLKRNLMKAAIGHPSHQLFNGEYRVVLKAELISVADREDASKLENTLNYIYGPGVKFYYYDKPGDIDIAEVIPDSLALPVSFKSKTVITPVYQ
jgi:hypothetical protein